ncbi:unnamed protein product [Rhizophagus irregularis]|uniref:MIR domain-containing protein n=1 Tax=Rhizophagus irregularis TaxID=588596 RepID=A0A915YZL0_9GLOM|nr:unnamed protein product [Rhizophagus irregularis]CAB5355622.1 unnamed protein product [Rhizophagus irregularis]
MKNLNSIDELIKRFEELVLEESNLIRKGSIVALKHVATGKYLSSIKNLCYTTGSKFQLVFAGSPEPVPNSLWKAIFDDELATYTDNSMMLQHVKSERFLGIYCVYNSYGYDYCKSPLNNYTEVGCRGNEDGRVEFLRSHDIQFTIGNDSFQEVACHNERLGGNDEWCIELIRF